MQQIFWPDSLRGQTHLTLAGNEFQHLIKVLRLKMNDRFWIVDHEKQTYQAQIQSVSRQDFTVQLVPQLRIHSELPNSVKIACALSKKDKVEWITQKATELGVTEIIFFKSHYAVKKWDNAQVSKKITRLQQIALHAAQQSWRLQVPQVRYAASLAQVLATTAADYRLVAYEEAAKNNEQAQLAQICQQMQPQQSLLAFFGPEGGFTVEEINQMRQNGCIVCGLGPRILRAETAPLYFLSAVSYQTELSKDF